VPVALDPVGGMRVSFVKTCECQKALAGSGMLLEGKVIGSWQPDVNLRHGSSYVRLARIRNGLTAATERLRRPARPAEDMQSMHTAIPAAPAAPTR
jgi:hypothetical protein